MLPGPFGPGQGDEWREVEAHDLQVRMYDELYARGGWTRLRLRLKVAGDPMNPATERQLLIGGGVLVAFLVWDVGGASGRGLGPHLQRELAADTAPRIHVLLN